MSSPTDEPVRLPTGEAATIHHGYVLDLVSQQVDLGAGGQVIREYIRHPGAVAIVALDEDERMVLLRQYRHPVAAYLWEVPAGLLDVPGEDLVSAAARELAEEADLRANRWHTLADYYTSPGASDEAIRVFLARDLTAVPDDERHHRVAEEMDMPVQRVELAHALEAVLDGRIHNPSTVVGVLTAHVLASRDWSGLRPADAPWLPRAAR